MYVFVSLSYLQRFPKRSQGLFEETGTMTKRAVGCTLQQSCVWQKMALSTFQCRSCNFFSGILAAEEMTHKLTSGTGLSSRGTTFSPHTFATTNNPPHEFLRRLSLFPIFATPSLRVNRRCISTHRPPPSLILPSSPSTSASIKAYFFHTTHTHTHGLLHIEGL